MTHVGRRGGQELHRSLVRTSRGKSLAVECWESGFKSTNSVFFWGFSLVTFFRLFCGIFSRSKEKLTHRWQTKHDQTIEDMIFKASLSAVRSNWASTVAVFVRQMQRASQRFPPTLGLRQGPDGCHGCHGQGNALDRGLGPGWDHCLFVHASGGLAETQREAWEATDEATDDIQRCWNPTLALLYDLISCNSWIWLEWNWGYE